MDFGFESSGWVNPTDTPVVMEFCISANAEVGKADKRSRVSIPTVGTVLSAAEKQLGIHVVDDTGKLLFTRLPKELDMAIHQVRDGVIVGGLGTRLVRHQGEQLPLAGGLNSAEEDKNAAIEEARKALEARKAADEALIIAGGKQASAEAKADAQKAPKAGK